MTARSEYVAPANPGNPFNDGSRAFAGTGLDVKYGVASNLTLDATVNPDFGQVEVDPAVVNLSASETFFEEKRPFFTEGSQILSRFGKSGASEYWSYFFFEPQLFYSRRIGRAPQAPAVGRHVDTPTTTTILGAAKLTGKTRRGWTLGALEAVTGPEYSRVSDGLAVRDDVQAEPLTNYFVGRAQHTVGSRASLGLLTTMVHRADGSPELENRLVGQAYVGGLDGHVFLDARRDWVLSGGVAGSSLHGSEGAIARVQVASQRYLQRPDATHLGFDPDAYVAVGLDRESQPESQPRQRHGERGDVGHEPGLRIQRRGVHDAGRSRRRPRPGVVPQADARPVHPHAAARRREVVDVELGRRLAGRRRAGRRPTCSS